MIIQPPTKAKIPSHKKTSFLGKKAGQNRCTSYKIRFRLPIFTYFEMSQRINLTVAKICHEMANYLSVLNFIREDIKNTQTPEVQEMMKNIELLTCTMEFFRSIYSDKINPNILEAAINKIYDSKGIDVLGFNYIELPNNVKGAICGLLYIIMKVSKPGDIVNIANNTNKIAVSIPENRNLPSNVSTALSKKVVEDNIFNVFVNYVKELAKTDGYGIELKNQEVIVWKK